MIENPIDYKIKYDCVRVKSADKITWSFYSYGDPHTSKTLCIVEFNKIDNSNVHFTGKSNWWNEDKFIDISRKIAIQTY